VFGRVRLSGADTGHVSGHLVSAAPHARGQWRFATARPVHLAQATVTLARGDSPPQAHRPLQGDPLMATRRTSDSTRTPSTPAAKPTAKSAAKSASGTKSGASIVSKTPDAGIGSKAPTDAQARTSAQARTDAQPRTDAPQSPPPATPSAASNPADASRVAKPKTLKGSAPAKARISDETRRAMIAESAYLRAERRGFAPGHEVEDWCAAEREVDALLNANTGAGPQ
jgi:Protein of unknown function (DUF2934)